LWKQHFADNPLALIKFDPPSLTKIDPPL
jgi:hypothetical protein